LNPLSSIYKTVARTRNSFYDRGVLSARRLRGTVISVGNISAGGSGKTPFVIALGELLKHRGVSFDVLTRGYGRRTRGVQRVDPDGSPRDFGDEPLLIARTLDVSVIVGEDRYAAGKFAEDYYGPRLHLLDDGFQHRGLARDLNIVMVNPSDATDRLLPAGRLREPLTSLVRADAIVLTNDGTTDGLPLHHHRIWRVWRGIEIPQTDEPCFAFCGIARPDNFFAQLREAGMTIAGTKRFRDHHLYTESDVRVLLKLQKRAKATAFLTTEKDAINLQSLFEKLGQVYVVPVVMQIEEPDGVLKAIVAAITARNIRST
jgi:tetraacyldisaccharide 4'-kinase